MLYTLGETHGVWRSTLGCCPAYVHRSAPPVTFNPLIFHRKAGNNAQMVEKTLHIVRRASFPAMSLGMASCKLGISHDIQGGMWARNQCRRISSTVDKAVLKE